MSARTLIVGLGNPILGDDGVGWHVADEVQSRIHAPTSDLRPQGTRDQRLEIDVDCVSLGGLSLMERMVGYERAIVIDAVSTGRWPTGTVSRLALEDLPDVSAGHTSSAHDTSLQTALTMGRAMGVSLPAEVTVVAVEAQTTYDFSEELSAPVEAAVPRAADLVLELVQSEFARE